MAKVKLRGRNTTVPLVPSPVLMTALQNGSALGQSESSTALWHCSCIVRKHTVRFSNRVLRELGELVVEVGAIGQRNRQREREREVERE